MHLPDGILFSTVCATRLLAVATGFVMILAGNSFLNRKNHLGRPQKNFNPLNRHPGSSKPEPGC